MAEPLRFTAADSGALWRGDPAGSVVSGGALLGDWSSSEVEGATLWSAPLPPQVEFSRTLWVHGERRNRTVVHGANLLVAQTVSVPRGSLTYPAHGGGAERHSAG